MNPDLIAYMALAGGIAAIISLVVAALTHRSSGTTRLLGTFISVGFLTAGIFIFIVSGLLNTIEFGILASVIVWLSFIVTISVIASAVAISRLFPDEKPAAVTKTAPKIKEPALSRNEDKTEKEGSNDKGETENRPPTT